VQPALGLHTLAILSRQQPVLIPRVHRRAIEFGLVQRAGRREIRLADSDRRQPIVSVRIRAGPRRLSLPGRSHIVGIARQAQSGHDLAERFHGGNRAIRGRVHGVAPHRCGLFVQLHQRVEHIAVGHVVLLGDARQFDRSKARLDVVARVRAAPVCHHHREAREQDRLRPDLSTAADEFLYIGDESLGGLGRVIDRVHEAGVVGLGLRHAHPPAGLDRVLTPAEILARGFGDPDVVQMRAVVDDLDVVDRVFLLAQPDSLARVWARCPTHLGALDHHLPGLDLRAATSAIDQQVVGVGATDAGVDDPYRHLP